MRKLVAIVNAGYLRVNPPIPMRSGLTPHIAITKQQLDFNCI